MPYYSITTNWSIEQSRRHITEQFRKWDNDAGDAVIGMTQFVAGKPGDATATIKFELRGTTVEVSCSSQWDQRRNMRCVAFAVESMRMNEKRGIADTMAKAYMQLEAPKEQRDAFEVLGVRPDMDMEVIDAVYKKLATTRHPDKGGSKEAMQELNDAMERIRTERGEAGAAP